MVERKEIHWADILVFSSVLVLSAAIGLFYAIKARRMSAEELMIGHRTLPLLPVVFSLSVSFVSAVSILGIPAEIYTNGSDYWMVGFGYIWALALTGFLALPLIYKLNLTSAYEYLELRFSKVIQLMASFTFIFMMLCYMAIVLYAPALALSSVTDLSMEVSILAIGMVCTFYTALGGIKAVIWTDVFQTIVITAGLLALIVRGTMKVGGVASVVDRVVNGSRDATYPMDFDPFIRHTFWTLTVGGGFGMMAIYAANQATLQRYLSVDSLKKSRLVLFINIPLSEFYLALMCLSGLVMYAYYHDRDPLVEGRISKKDQLLPLFVMDMLSDFPGMPGLFIACVFSAALSTVSSGVNALATVLMEDFIKPAILVTKGSLPSSRSMSAIFICTALLIGLLTIGAAYLSGMLSTTLLTIVVSVFGMMGGPLLGLILIGMLCPWVNSWGAGSALISSLIICMWTAIGAITKPRSRNPHNITVSASSERWDVDDWYNLSYQHYATLGVVVSLVVGSLVSFVTCCNKGRNLHKGTYYDVCKLCRKSEESSIDLDQYHLKKFDVPDSNIDSHNDHLTKTEQYL